MCLSNGQTNSIGETLAQGPCRNFDAWSVMRLWVTWGDAVDMLRARAVSQMPVVFVDTWRLTLKSFKSFIVTSYPNRWRSAYWSMQPWPFLKERQHRFVWN